ncbi:YtxH domain-containing protein [Mucilaginibacter sp. JRF]|uniref:YtxH domain-containing protein n=1 Tax=Mucilaginibacter sp. JRF TaxID=2780088 RepID=UPI00187F5D8C|nr:YtxH domain-containing protein [Mucilaginibacter sp. JRF]MBE9582916.1 YtxH domain-containing protein [Mucilaginibacter sp. JRF]
MKDQSKLLAALLIGAAAGAAAALLLAPDSGKATREDIADYFGDLLDATKEKANKAASTVKDYSNSVVDKAKAKFQHASENVSDYTDTLVDTAKAKGSEYVGEAKGAVKDTANNWNNAVQNS